MVADTTEHKPYNLPNFFRKSTAIACSPSKILEYQIDSQKNVHFRFEEDRKFDSSVMKNLLELTWADNFMDTYNPSNKGLQSELVRVRYKRMIYPFL